MFELFSEYYYTIDGSRAQKLKRQEKKGGEREVEGSIIMFLKSYLLKKKKKLVRTENK